jgi:glycerol transport system ATP-binding protein
MATIHLNSLRHSYLVNPSEESDYALRELNLSWSDGGAYALLGPSGCGKTTLLNLISGLLTPTEGRIIFNQSDVTDMPPESRNIAQVFQFPVVYDTMTIYDNLAFPLRNRGISENVIKQRVSAIAEMLELSSSLDQKASGLSADGKQKVSMGRGLVREDVAAMLFDEPLTVIDPQLKWRLRSQLKELHQRIARTMIYVTHDQTEALTFADQVIVMNQGVVVQSGTPVELFEHPGHVFVGHFIGSPGMNFLHCEMDSANIVRYKGHAIEFSGSANLKSGLNKSLLQIGIRPEFIGFGEQDGILVDIVQVDDLGRHRIVHTRAGNDSIKVVIEEHKVIPEGKGFLQFNPEFTHLYSDGWAVSGGRPSS